ncbi:MAG: chloroperoxidase, partial [Blastocatellia bacterium]
MIPKHRIWLSALALAIALSSLLVPVSAQQKYRTTEEIWGAKFGYTSYKYRVRADKASGLTGLRRWNQIAIDASGLDHTPPAPGEDRAFGEQLGPCRASRAIAIVQIAVFEALNAIVKKYDSHVGMYSASKKTNRDVAIAQAAHDTLVVLFPSQKGLFDMKLNEDLAAAPNNAKKANAILVGRTAALAALGLCYNDGSKHAEQLMNTEYVPSDQPGFWRQDPISLVPIALGARWAEVRPLIMTSASQFRLPPAPAIDSAEYADAYNEVKRLGGDGIVTPTERTDEQTHLGIFWAYDGTPSLCAPPRLYNQIAMQLADQRATNDIDTARMLALINVAMAEAG